MFTAFTGSFRAGRRRQLIGIVRAGLQLHLDAGNLDSYPGTGTTWKDISGNNNNIIMSGATYSSGAWIFDGVDDYADFFAPNISGTATVEMWVKLSVGYAGGMFFGWQNYDVWTSGGHIGYNTGAGDVYGISSTQATNLGVVDNWKHYVFEMRSDVSYVNNKIYINGAEQSLAQQQNSESAGNRNFNSGNGRIAGWIGSTGYRIPMTCSVFKVYNRSLTSAEVTQNFNAVRSRYGV